jgi:hypothetical protein
MLLALLCASLLARISGIRAQPAGQAAQDSMSATVLYNENRKEVTIALVAYTSHKSQIKTTRQRRPGEWIHAVQGLPAAGINS